MKQQKYRAIIIEPSEIIREGVKVLLEQSSYIHVTACFPDFQSFEDKIIKDDFHIIIINPVIKFYKSVNIRNLLVNYPNVCLIAIVYQHFDKEMLQNFDGILDIYDDGEIISHKVMKIVEATQQNDQSVNANLSDREKDILIALAKGLSNKEIADKLYISTHTVISHRKNIVRKTGIKTVSGLTLYALFNNLVSQDEFV
jgi:DNA-binding NarL/FixJ family response regulator